jgi:hypothetical protein
MNLAAWAERNGVARVTAYRWLGGGVLAVSARKVRPLILVDETSREGERSRTAVYARVSSADQEGGSGSAGGAGDCVGCMAGGQPTTAPSAHWLPQRPSSGVRRDGEV